MIKFLIGLLIAVVILIIALIIAMCPGKKRDSSNFSGKLYAHRGLHNIEKGIPENSLAAFRAAKENGYGVELDVQLTADNKLVVFHDGSLKRMCGADVKVFELTYEELSQYRLLGTEEKIPLFSEVLEVMGDSHIVCEIKTHSSNTDMAVCPIVYEHIKDKPNICIESFNPFAVVYFRKHYPEIIRGQLAENFFRVDAKKAFFKKFSLTFMLFNASSKPDFIAYNHFDRNFFVFRICRALFKPFCVAWTVRSPEEQKNCDGIFSAVIFEKYLAE